ncbi:hypothetical protein LCGC14_2161720 [marine sediment metagenome]|uniref:Uncharacterized protein n=1 Tax=marine sediment metagenome TaxID=412755 RepID=A0A0F9DSI8_9ZZZZ
MTLLLKAGKPENHILELVREGDNIEVHMDGECVAEFRDNGEFILHGIDSSNRFDGRWDKE